MLFFWLVAIAATFLSYTQAKGCDFHFEIEDPQPAYHIGSEIVITVSVVLTHRVCEIELEDTHFSARGMKIIGATKWIQLSSKVYARKFKVKITEENTPAVFTALRECDRDGGKGSLEIKIS